MMKTILKIIGIIALLVILQYVITIYFIPKGDELSQENKRLQKSLDSLKNITYIIEQKNKLLEDTLKIIQNEKITQKENIKLVYIEVDRLKDAPIDTIAKKVDEVYTESFPNNALDNTQGKVLDNKPKLVIEPLIAIDYILAKKLNKQQTTYINLIEKENIVLSNQKTNYEEEIKNYKQMVSSSEKISSNMNIMLKQEKNKNRLYSSLAYGAVTSSVLFGIKASPNVALPVGLLIGTGKYFFFN